VLCNYDGGHLTIDVDMNIPGLKIGIRSYERTSVTVVGTFSANVDTIIIRGQNSGNNHCPPAITTNTVVSAAPATIKIYQNGQSSLYNYACGSVNNTQAIISYFTNGNAARLRGYTSWYECWCNPQKLSIAAAYCCKGAYTCFTALPLDLVSFDVFPSKDLNHLKWSTQNEINVDRFEIEASDEEENAFTTIGKMNLNNSRSSNHEYEFKHALNANKTMYYRLKMIDIDNTYKYSKIIVADHSNKNETFYLKNNLVENEIEFIKQEVSLDIEIYNLNGTRVKKVRVPSAENKILFNDVPAGMYLLRNNLNADVFKFIKL